jgi:hypothetical protein
MTWGLVADRGERGVSGVECGQARVSLTLGGVCARGHPGAEGMQAQVVGALSPLLGCDSVVDADARRALPGCELAHLA